MTRDAFFDQILDRLLDAIARNDGDTATIIAAQSWHFARIFAGDRASKQKRPRTHCWKSRPDPVELLN